MILVTVGTHEQPFDRLVRAAADLVGDEPVIVQRGVSRVHPVGCEVHDWMHPADLARALREARVVVCHAGPATIFEARAAGHIPIVVPRDPAFDEHVDDHQLRFARRITGQARVVFDPREIAAACVGVEPGSVATTGATRRTRDFAAGVEQVCRRAIARSARPASRRDTLRALYRWMRPHHE